MAGLEYLGFDLIWGMSSLLSWLKVGLQSKLNVDALSSDESSPLFSRGDLPF